PDGVRHSSAPQSRAQSRRDGGSAGLQACQRIPSHIIRAVTTLRAILAATALSILIVQPATTSQQKPADPIFESLATLVTAKMHEYRIPGVAMGVLRDGQTTIRGFGIRNVNDPQPVTNQTVFPLASISKTVTTTALLRLVEQGKADLHAPVRKYLPDFRVADE